MKSKLNIQEKGLHLETKCLVHIDVEGVQFGSSEEGPSKARFGKEKEKKNA